MNTLNNVVELRPKQISDNNEIVITNAIKMQPISASTQWPIKVAFYVDINDPTRTSKTELAEEVNWILSSLDDYVV